MLTVEPRSLLRRLSPTCTRALEAAAASCVGSRHYEVTVEHLLSALLDDALSDVAAVFAYFNIDPTIARTAVGRTLGGLRSGNAGRPVFSSLLLEWMQDALLYGTAELGQPVVRSGALVVELAVAPTRYLPAEYPFLQAIPRDELRQNLAVIAATSGEAAEVAAAAAPGGPAEAPVPGAPAGDGPLARFTSDLTAAARAGDLDPVFGREQETRQMIEILVRRRKNNPIIVGEAGVGKTALVEGLAHRIADGTVPDSLRTVRLLALDLGALQAGAGVRGEFENRLKGVISEVKSSAQPTIVFIDEAHTLIGAGGAQGGGDAANLLKPALARGELRTIAATTYREFKKYFEKDAALERRFHPVHVGEPSVETATQMLRGLVGRFRGVHDVVIQDEAVRAAVHLSSRYISGRQLPDKAVDLLDTAAAYVKLVRAAPPAALEDLQAEHDALERELAAYEADEQAGVTPDAAAREAARERQREVALRLEQVEQEVAQQREVVGRIDELRARRAERLAGEQTSEAESGGAPHSAAAAEQEAEDQALRGELERVAEVPMEQRLVTPDVDESVVAAIVSGWTGIPVGKMVKDDVAVMLSLEERLRERVRGQDPALSLISRELRAARSGLKPPQTPLGVFLLVGPSGVGKTETALALADLLFGGERFVVTVNMSEFQERHTVSRLIGSPPGYVGYGEGGVLTEAVRHRPYSVVLLDEVEKADPEVMNLFYQVFDKGMLSDGEGRVVDFKNTVVIMTSNLGTDVLTNAAPPGEEPPGFDELVDLVKPALSAHFKPALVARMTVVPYVPLGPDALREIAGLKLSGLVGRARAAHGLELTVADEVVAAIVERCTEVESGARNVDHILRGSILPLVSNEILRALADDTPVDRMRLTLGEDRAVRCEQVASEV